MKKPKVGERYYYVPYDKRREGFEVEVNKVGKKYFYAIDSWHLYKFKIDSFVEDCGDFSPEGRLYDDKESYLKHNDVIEKGKQLTNSMIHLLDDDDLLEVYEIVKKKLV